MECSQARDLQLCCLNAQRANLDSEIEIKFLSGEGARQGDGDSSDLAPVELDTTSGSKPADIDSMLALISVSGSAELQRRIRLLLCRKNKVIFSRQLCIISRLWCPLCQ